MVFPNEMVGLRDLILGVLFWSFCHGQSFSLLMFVGLLFRVLIIVCLLLLIYGCTVG